MRCTYTEFTKTRSRVGLTVLEKDTRDGEIYYWEVSRSYWGRRGNALWTVNKDLTWWRVYSETFFARGIRDNKVRIVK